jgi:hypothetical protein
MEATSGVSSWKSQAIHDDAFESRSHVVSTKNVLSIKHSRRGYRTSISQELGPAEMKGISIGSQDGTGSRT